MARRPRPWIVTPHDPFEKHDDHLWTVTGAIPGLTLKRRMTIARLAGGDLVFYNAVPLADAALAELRAWGRPAFVVIPNRYHKIDAHAFRERLGVRLLCHASVARFVGEIVTVDGGLELLPADPHVRLAPIAGTKQGETALIVTGARGTSVAFADAIMNVPRGSGLFNALLGVSGGLKCPPTFRMIAVADKAAVARDLAALADLPGLARLIPSHGDILEHDPADALRRAIARDLEQPPR